MSLSPGTPREPEDGWTVAPEIGVVVSEAVTHGRQGAELYNAEDGMPNVHWDVGWRDHRIVLRTVCHVHLCLRSLGWVYQESLVLVLYTEPDSITMSMRSISWLLGRSVNV